MDSIIFAIDGRTDLINQFEHEMEVGVVNVKEFSDGEVCVDFETSVRGKRVYILSSPNTANKIMQLNFAIDAAKRAAAKEIIPILPYFPYARQDKKDQSRGPIGAKVMAEMLEQRGATHVITFDLHADQIQGFFNIPVTHMEGKYLFISRIYDLFIQASHNKEQLVLCSPDAGGTKRVKHFRDLLKTRYNVVLPIVMIDKTRLKANEIDEMVIIGDVTDKHVIIIDDMCDTAGTLVKACDSLLENGAKKVSSIVTHGVLSGPALERIYFSKLSNFICSDSLDIPATAKLTNNKLRQTKSFITQVSTAKQIMLAIEAIDKNCSVDELKAHS